MMAFLAVDVEIRRRTLTIAARFDADAGETIALLGPNGAGKSSVLEAIAGVLPAERAVVEVAGDRIDGLPPERRPLGVSFQGARLFPSMSVLENVAFPLRARGIPRADAHRRARASIAEVVGAGVAEDARPDSLSGGQEQRVALARALVAEPRLLLLDEPLAAVDVSARAGLRALLRRVTASFEGVCVLVAHDPIDALTLADRIVVLEHGAITQVGTPRALREAPASPYVADLVGVNLVTGTLEPLDGGAARLRTIDGGALVIAMPDRVPARGEVMATLAPSDIALHLSEPEGSARNVLRGAVEEVALVGDRARVRLATRPALVAEVTRGSVDRLGLAPGVEVYASCKAVEVRLVGSSPVP